MEYWLFAWKPDQEYELINKYESFEKAHGDMYKLKDYGYYEANIVRTNENSNELTVITSVSFNQNQKIKKLGRKS